MTLVYTQTQLRKRLPGFVKFLEVSGATILLPSDGYVVQFHTHLGWGGIKLPYDSGHTVTQAHFHGLAIAAWASMLAGATGWLSAMRPKKLPKRSNKHELVLARDGNLCFYCGQPLGDDVTMEHLIPTSQGGPNTIHNLVACHAACNLQAGPKSLLQKLAIRDALHAAKHLQHSQDA